VTQKEAMVENLGSGQYAAVGRSCREWMRGGFGKSLKRKKHETEQRRQGRDYQIIYENMQSLRIRTRKDNRTS
jgi:hypothetical protein